MLLFLVTLSTVPGQSQKHAAAKSKNTLSAAIDRTLEQGHDAILPPHISHLLGISPAAQEVPVKQFVQMGEPIRGFEVASAEHNNVILFVENRGQKQTTFYLTSRRGVLRKVLAVIEGVGHDRLPTQEDRQAFEKEKQYWVDRLALKPL